MSLTDGSGGTLSLGSRKSRSLLKRHQVGYVSAMPVMGPDEVGDRLESRGDAERRTLASAIPKLLFGVAAVVLVLAVVGNALVWTSWTTLYNTQTTPTAWLWGQFLSAIALPVGLAGVLVGSGLIVARWDDDRPR